MKLLIFTTQFYWLYGAERLAVELAVGLNRAGVHADVLSLYAEDPRGRATKERLLDGGVPAVEFLGRKTSPGPLGMGAAVGKLRRLLLRGGYQIVETSTVGPSLLACWACKGLRARHVEGIHTILTREWHNDLRHRLWRWSHRCSPETRYYAVSHQAAACWSEYSGCSAARVRTVYNSIADAFFEAHPDRAGLRRELGVADDARLVLFVGRLTRPKGIATLLEAVGPLLHERNLYLLYVGEADNNIPHTAETLQHMKATADARGWRERVRFLGHRSDLPRIMASSDLMVHPPTIEGFGLVLVEAMAAGLPIVASRAGGIPEVLAGTGHPMVEPENPETLRNAVQETLEAPDEEIRRRCAQARRRAEEFRSERRIHEMVSLFEDVVSRRW